MASTTFIDKQTVIPTAWLNEVNGTVWSLFGAASTPAAGRTALGATATGDALFTAANAAAGRSALSLGTSATVNTGTSGATIPLLNGANTWSGNQDFASQINVKFLAINPTFPTTDLGAIDATYLFFNSSFSGTITSFGTSGNEGTIKIILFGDSTGVTLQHGSNILMPFSSTTTVYNGDMAIFIKEPGPFWRCFDIKRGVSTGNIVTVRRGASVTLDPYAVNQSVTTTHNLGATPSFVTAYLECKTGELGYNVGERIDIASWGGVVTSVTGINFMYNSTNTYLLTHATNLPQVLNAGTRAAATITAANWRIVVTPYLVGFFN